MELIELPLENHYLYMTKEGFSTFIVSDNLENVFEFHVQDVPLRFVVNILTSDTSDTKQVEACNQMIERFKFHAIKFFGFPVLSDMSFKDVLANFEHPLKTLLRKQKDDFSRFTIETEIEMKSGHVGQKMKIKQSPLFVFTRNGIVDPH